MSTQRALNHWGALSNQFGVCPCDSSVSRWFPQIVVLLVQTKSIWYYWFACGVYYLYNTQSSGRVHHVHVVLRNSFLASPSFVLCKPFFSCDVHEHRSSFGSRILRKHLYIIDLDIGVDILPHISIVSSPLCRHGVRRGGASETSPTLSA